MRAKLRLCYGRVVTASARREIYASAAVALAASLWLFALAPIYRIDHFYVAGQTLMSNDQVGYLTSARWLAETGELRSHLIYPAHVRDTNWRLYMPGHYYVLAAGHLLFGAGPVAWRMPALLSFVVAAVGVFLVGLRFYGRSRGAIAAFLFIVFSPVAAFAFTAMPQLPFLAVSLAAFGAFAYLPARLRPILLPCLLAVPFLYRETGALLVIPMAVVMLAEGGARKWRSSLLSVFGAVALLYGLLHWQVASGKDSLPLDGSRFNYANAFRPEPPAVTVGSFVEGLRANVRRNLDAVKQHASRKDAVFVSAAILFALTLLAIVRGIKGDALALGAGLLCVAAGLVITVFYTWELYRGLRSLLFTFPLLAASAAPWVRRAEANWLKPLGAAVLLALSFWGSKSMASHATATDGARAVAVMEGLELDHDGVLVAPPPLALDYVLYHYPLRWSFVPRNQKTLELLAETHALGTIILPENALGRSLTVPSIEAVGLQRTRTFRHRLRLNDATFVVFERAQRGRSER